MDKTAIKNFAMWARNALIRNTKDKCGLVGIQEDGIQEPLPQSTADIQFFDAGTGTPSSITGIQISQRDALVKKICEKERDSDYLTAYNYVVEQVAYTWFNRLIAIRFMEVNDYLPSRIRVLSSEQAGKLEPDIVTTPFDADFDFRPEEEEQIRTLKSRGQKEDMDTLFRILFVKQCGALHELLPGLFQKVDGHDYTELLLNISFTDRDGVVYRLVNDIPESNFDVSQDGQVEIIGWLYQYYNAELKDDTFALLKKNVKITKERIPAATQLFTPDWIVKYMVENSLGRLWVDGHPNDGLKENWRYYLEEAEQEPEVQAQLAEIRQEYAALNPDDIKVIDPCMGSGHILVYAFDVLMQIYGSQGYTPRDAAQRILEYNIWGLDIDERAYQLSYFAVLMKARQYDRQILKRGIHPHVYVVQESNSVNRVHLKYFGATLDEFTRNNALNQVNSLLDQMTDAKEYGSLLSVDAIDFDLMREFVEHFELEDQMDWNTLGVDDTQKKLQKLIQVGEMLANKYGVVCTNPPYMSSGNMNTSLAEFVKMKYPDAKSDLSTAFMERTLSLCNPTGYMSMINIPVWMFLSSYERLRANLIDKHTLINMLHLGRGVFGSDFGTTAFILWKKYIRDYTSVYRKLHTEVGSVDSIEQKEVWFFEDLGYYFSKSDWYKRIPSTPFAYWLTESAVNLFVDVPPLQNIADPRQGLATGNDDKYLRQWQEIDFTLFNDSSHNIAEFWEDDALYAPFNKGGSYRKWYGNNTLVIRFSKCNYEQLMQSGNHLPSRNFYFKPGITWTALTAGDFSGRICGEGFVFSGKGPMCFPYRAEDTYYLLGYLNSKLTGYFMKIFSSTTDFNQGPMRFLPLIMNEGFEKQAITNLVKSNIEISNMDWDSYETSWNFKRHPLV